MQHQARRSHRTAVLLLALLGLVLPVGVGSSASAATRTGTFEKAVVREVNEHRAARDLPPLRSLSPVAECYDEYAERGARALQRRGVSAYSVSRASQECPRTALGEALGRMKVRPARLVERWMRDSERRDMLLHRSADHIAVGAVRNRRGVWSVDLFVVEGRWGAEDSTDSTDLTSTERSTTGLPSADPALGGVRDEILAATNGERARAGVPDLALLDCLNANAQRHAERMARTGVLAHQSLQVVQEECGFRKRVGENVAVNSRGAGASMVEQWMASAGHRANILEREFRYIGVGAARDAEGRWWGVQVFFGAPLG